MNRALYTTKEPYIHSKEPYIQWIEPYIQPNERALWFTLSAEEITLQIFASPDLSVFLLDLLSDGDSIYSREQSFELLELPWKYVWYVRGLLWKLVGNFGSRNYHKSDLLQPWVDSKETDILSKEAYVYSRWARPYGVATISRLLEMIGLFGKRVL